MNTKTMYSSQKFLENAFKAFNNKGYVFKHIAELHIITIANKLGMSYDLYIKHKMHAFDCKLNAIFNKKPNLVNKLNHTDRHSLIRNFSYVPISKI